MIELNKLNSPSLLLEDFNYLFNKAINQYVNKKYNVYDIDQLRSDDMRVLKATAILTPKRSTIYTDEYNTSIGSESDNVTVLDSLYGATYEVNLPFDYLHLLNCICVFKVKKTFKCYDRNTYVQFGATRLTADLWGLIIHNFYMKPSYKHPYYYIHNVNTSTKISTNPLTETTDDYGETIYNGTDISWDENGDDMKDTEVTYEFSATPKTITFTSDGGTKYITVVSLDSNDNSIDWVYTNVPSWLTAQQINNKLLLTAAENTETAAKTGTILLVQSATNNAPITITITLKAKSSTDSGETTVSYTKYYGTSITEPTTATEVMSGSTTTLSYVNITPYRVYYIWVAIPENITVSSWIDSEGDAVSYAKGNTVSISNVNYTIYYNKTDAYQTAPNTINFN